MSTVRVETAGQEALDRAAKLLAGIEGGMDKAVKNALARAVSHLRTNSAKAIRERYAISAANIRANETITVSYHYQNGPQALVLFSGHRIPLIRYDGASPKSPIPGNPNYPVYGHQLNSTSPTRFSHAFAAQMPVSGHTGFFERTGGKTSSGKDEIRELLGSSVPQMLGSQDVEETLAKESMEKFEERLDHEVLRILSGWGG